MEKKLFDVSWSFCFKIVLTILFFYFLFLIKNLIILFIFALVLSVLFNFFIDFLEKIKIPRLLATIVVYFGIVFIFILFIYQFCPLLISEIKELAFSLPFYFQKINEFLEKTIAGFKLDFQFLLESLKENLGKITENIFIGFVVFFGGFNALILIFFLAFFMSLQRQFLEKLLINIAHPKYHSYLLNLASQVKRRVNRWFIARLVGVIFVTILTFIVFTLLNIKYALILSLLFGIFDFVPIIGPIIAGIIIVSIIMLDSFPQALVVLIILVIIQQLENILLFPFLFKKFIDLPPVLVLIALGIGATLGGVLGAILSIPLIGIIFEIIKDYLKFRRQQYFKEQEGQR